VAQIKQHHFTFVSVTIFYDFDAYKLGYIKQQNEMVLILLLYVNICSPDGATNLNTFSAL